MTISRVECVRDCQFHGATEHYLKKNGPNSRKGGHSGYSYVCIECERERHQSHRSEEARRYGPIKNPVCQKCFTEKANNGSCCCD